MITASNIYLINVLNKFLYVASFLCFLGTIAFLVYLLFYCLAYSDMDLRERIVYKKIFRWFIVYFFLLLCCLFIPNKDEILEMYNLPKFVQNKNYNKMVYDCLNKQRDDFSIDEEDGD